MAKLATLFNQVANLATLFNQVADLATLLCLLFQRCGYFGYFSSVAIFVKSTSVVNCGVF